MRRFVACVEHDNNHLAATDCSAVASVQNIDVGIKTICDKMLRADTSGLLPLLGLLAHGQNPSLAARFVQRVVEIPKFGQH